MPEHPRSADIAVGDGGGWRPFHPYLLQFPVVTGTGPGVALEQRARTLADLTRKLDRVSTAEVPPGTYQNLTPAARSAQAQRVAKMLMVSLTRGDTYMVAAEISALLAAAATAIPDDADLSHEMVPADAGFCFFTQPIPLVQGMIGPIRAISWCCLYSGNAATNDQPWIPVTGDTQVGANATKTRLIFWLEKSGWICPMTQLSWSFGESLTTLLDHVGDEHEERPSLAEKVRIAYAFLAFIQQRILEWTSTSADRASQHRAAALAPQIKNAINVIRLRRVEHRTPEITGTPVDWAYRWMVSGHWRRQPCGRQRTDRRLLWIHAHIKGPEDKPIKAPAPRVFAVVR